MNKRHIYIFLVLGIFSIAMAFLETAVVVYLRELYYPEGFAFPLNPIDVNIAVVEILRELATLIMLITIALIAGNKRVERFSYFIFNFAIWDIFYYIFLKMVLGWPESLVTWDVLFLIPFTWTGPVIAPVINSMTMIAIAILLIVKNDKKQKLLYFKGLIWLLIVGSVFVLAAYLKEYMVYMADKFTFIEILSVKNTEVMHYAEEFVPHNFSWGIFLTGFAIHLVAITIFIKKNK